MATPPVKPASPKPNPLHGPPPPVEPKPEQVQVNIHGIPPKPNMEEPPAIDERYFSPNTLAEMEAGRRGLETSKARLEAEYAAGRNAVREAEARLRRVTPESKE